MVGSWHICFFPRVCYQVIMYANVSLNVYECGGRERVCLMCEPQMNTIGVLMYGFLKVRLS